MRTSRSAATTLRRGRTAGGPHGERQQRQADDEDDQAQARRQEHQEDAEPGDAEGERDERVARLAPGAEAEGLGEEAGNGHRSVTVRSDFRRRDGATRRLRARASPTSTEGLGRLPDLEAAEPADRVPRGAAPNTSMRTSAVAGSSAASKSCSGRSTNASATPRVVADAEQARAREEPVDEALPDEDVDQPRDQGLGS